MSTPPSSNPRPVETPSSPNMSIWYALRTTLLVAILAATFFTLWTPDSVTLSSLLQSLQKSIPNNAFGNSATQTPTPFGQIRIGIISGHMGNDSGTVCSDGLTEAEINLKIATLVKQDLLAKGYQVDLLDEFDTRLSGYKAALLLSIHNDSCQYINDQASGFKVAASSITPDQTISARLTSCMVDRYHTVTSLPFDYNSITTDMTQYHAFSEVDSNTPAAIIEAGFMNLDRVILTQHTDKVALGITNGIICFLNNEVVQPTPTSTP